MRRVRIVFALLSLALLGSAGLLLQRDVAAAQAEREAQRTTLAARVFDEMERALSDFLSSEELLSFGGWMAPVAADPPFVSARFELAPGSALRLSPGAPPAVAPLLAAWAERRAAPREAAPLVRESGERVAAGDAVDEKVAVAEQKAFAPPSAPAPRPAQESLYDALQSLNRGAEGRAQRARKLEAAAELEAPAPTSVEQLSKTAPSAAAAGAPPMAEAPMPSPEPVRRGVVAAQRVVVDPLLGDQLGAGRLLLVRTVLAGDRGYRQGLVLEVEALGDWLRERGLSGAILRGASLAFAPAGHDRAPALVLGAFRHRFAEPFDALETALVLPALPDAARVDTVLRLSLLLVAVGFAGLFALYRMVAVALRFAEQRSNFVAAVSHELKTPLTAIRMYGEMLRDGLVSTDEKRAEYHRTITAESERLSRLIDNVLEFASSERGERSLALRIGPVGAELERLCDALRPHAAEAGFTLELNAPSGLPAVAFDHDSVAQILVNLVDNALKYARGCSRRVVRIECVEEGGGVALRVRDFGPGVAPHEVGRVFDLFQRGESELTRTTRGTGLGLALVRSLSRRMGARASARNAEGGGFEVSVVFPRPAKG